ncbi:hypothetical protein [Stenotrophomonas muris]|uniref:hypothetical protein n=1 Tax=Stenotrophomonas muris TaxID=2963283 RepID=UPI0011D2A3A0|nr:hypothetical protein [Stenotrophomonas muris]
MGIAGCSTAPGLLEQTPESFASSKSVQQVTVCLSQTWTQRNKVVRVLPTESGQRIVIDNPVNHGVIAIVELAPVPTGTSARYWKGAGLTGWTRDDLKACLD